MKEKISILMMAVFFLIPVYMRCNNNFVHTNSNAADTITDSRVIPANPIIAERPIKLIAPGLPPAAAITSREIPVDSIIEFAETLIGTRYLYGSADPSRGFDCSGFITYVFNHFKIPVPRSSIGFKNVGEEIAAADSKKGDLILFTGTNSAERFVGHIGLIVSNTSGNIQFIHSSSGKANGVVITPLDDYYKQRFIKVVRLSTGGLAEFQSMTPTPSTD
jgi:cell wall-associated NlpC family hydrolase